MQVDAKRTLKTKAGSRHVGILAVAGREDAQLPVRILHPQFKHRLSFMTHKVFFNAEILPFLKLN